MLLGGSVEMGVPIDRGLTHHIFSPVQINSISVEMGVPIDRGLTRTSAIFPPCALARL